MYLPTIYANKPLLHCNEENPYHIVTYRFTFKSCTIYHTNYNYYFFKPFIDRIVTKKKTKKCRNNIF